jgi:hypothetical protein
VVLYVLLAVCALAGAALRFWILGNAPINSDEATAGLIAHQILHGHSYAFFWGQGYGGVEPYALAAVFWAAGQSPLTLDLTPTLLALVGAILVWRIGRRLFPQPAGLVAAVISWIWAESSLWNSTRESGYHEVCMVLGLVVLLQAVRIVQSARTRNGDRWVDWVVLGAAAGLGVWASPEIVYVAVPAGLVVLLSLRGRSAGQVAGRALSAASAAVLGALPLLWDTVGGHGGGLPASPASYPSRLGTFFSHVLPMVLGLRVEGAGQWEGGRLFGAAVSVLLLVAVVAGAVLLVAIDSDALVLGLTVALYPFLYAAFPTAWFWNDGRYAIGLSPVLALVAAGVLWQLLRPPVAAWTACAVLVAALVSTLVAFDAGYGALSHPDRLAHWSSNPNSAVTSLAVRLRDEGVSHAYAGYWVANDLTFLSSGSIVADAVGESRNPPGAATGAARSRSAWIFVRPQSTALAAAQLGSATDLDPGTVSEAELIAWLDAHHTGYTRRTDGAFSVIVPDGDVRPSQVSG